MRNVQPVDVVAPSEADDSRFVEPVGLDTGPFFTDAALTARLAKEAEELGKTWQNYDTPKQQPKRTL